MLQDSTPFPLTGMRVLDFCDRLGQSCGRMLADLGAEVILVEPPQGMISRKTAPQFNGTSLRFAVRNANKLSVALDLTNDGDKSQLLSIVDTIDLVIDGSEPGYLDSVGLGKNVLKGKNSKLIVLSISDFGLQGPYKDFIATDAVHIAMGAMLCRSGIDGREPLLPPGEMAIETASVQAAWVALLAYWQTLHTGQGDFLDYSVNDAVAQILDPGVGVTGSASAGKTAIEAAAHGRPVIEARPGEMPSVGLMYPYFKCADGFVRAAMLNPRQWDAMSNWLGDDHPYTGPKFRKPANRLFNITGINALISQLFATYTREELVDQGRKRGIPIGSAAKPTELFNSTHYKERDFFTSLNIGDKQRSETPSNVTQATVPSGYVRIDDRRVGVRTSAPRTGEHNNALLSARNETNKQLCGNEAPSRRPLEGILVLDLGVIVAGAEAGRLFADQGATVIKLENKAFGDGLRQSFDGNPVPLPFAQGSRGKQSLGLNLRSEKGKALFYQLAEKADVVLTNFKPGTTQSLGIDYKTLKALNPGIILSESSAIGSTGNEAKTMGYGPLVRASSCLSNLWRYPDQDDGFGDSTTIYPDHFAARVTATAVLAKLIERKRTGIGGFVDTSQAETIITALSTEFLRESVEPGSMMAKGNRNEFDAPNSVFECAGNDEWCVVAVSNDEQWQGLCAAMNRADLAKEANYACAAQRLQHREALEAILGDWCATLTPYQIMETCQAHAVPAGNMLRLDEFIQNPHYQARVFFRELNQPTVGRIVETENGPVAFNPNYCPPTIKRAPARAEHTRELAKEYLDLSDAEIDALAKNGDLEIGQPATAGVLKQKVKTYLIRKAVAMMLKKQAKKAQKTTR